MKYKTGDYVVAVYSPDLGGNIFSRVELLEGDNHNLWYVRLVDTKGQVYYVYAERIRPATDTEILHHKLLGF